MVLTRTDTCYHLRSRRVSKLPPVRFVSSPRRRNLPKKTVAPHNSKCPPQRQLDPGVVECQSLKCANLHNSRAAKRGEVTYDLVDHGLSSGFLHPRTGFCYHSNFLAKARNSSHDTPNMLFFAELWDEYRVKRHVNKCCILGPKGTVKLGLSGCIACDAMHHPPNSFDFGTKKHFRC